MNNIFLSSSLLRRTRNKDSPSGQRQQQEKEDHIKPETSLNRLLLLLISYLFASLSASSKDSRIEGKKTRQILFSCFIVHDDEENRATRKEDTKKLKASETIFNRVFWDNWCAVKRMTITEGLKSVLNGKKGGNPWKCEKESKNKKNSENYTVENLLIIASLVSSLFHHLHKRNCWCCVVFFRGRLIACCSPTCRLCFLVFLRSEYRAHEKLDLSFCGF